MGERAQAHRSCQRGRWVLRGGDYDVPTLLGYGLYDVFIWNMLSLNGMRPFGSKPNTKTVRTWPKVENIISFRAGCYIWY